MSKEDFLEVTMQLLSHLIKREDSTYVRNQLQMSGVKEYEIDSVLFTIERMANGHV